MSELTHLIRQGEGEQLDFKFRIDDQRKIAKTLVAFANSQGGRLLIGVKDNGKIVGVNPEEEFFMIEGAASMYCQPEVKFDSQVWQEGHHLVLEINVERSETRHKAKDEHNKWRTYYRIHDQTIAGNKIFDKLWAHRMGAFVRPDAYTDNELSVIAILKDAGRIRISGIYRKSNLSKAEVDRLVAALIHWGIVDFEIIEDGIYYYLRS